MLLELYDAAIAASAPGPAAVRPGPGYGEAGMDDGTARLIFKTHFFSPSDLFGASSKTKMAPSPLMRVALA